MAQPTNTELEALEDADALIKYAAENKPSLTNATILTLAQSQVAAQDDDKWEPQIIADFWTAFSALCNLIAPVTIDSIYANIRTIPRPQWRISYLRAQPIVSLSERTAQRYLVALLCLLVVSLVLSYMVNSVKATTDDVNGVLRTQASTVSLLNKELGQNEITLGQAAFDDQAFRTKAGADMRVLMDTMQRQAQSIHFAMSSANEEVTGLLSVFAPLNGAAPTETPDALKVNSAAQLKNVVDDYYALSASAARTLRRISGYANFINYAVMPILMGTIGACAFIVRMISEQIRTTTFSRVSPTRHIVRCALGALAGVIIGFGGAVAPSSAGASVLSTAALSFIAGYAIEPVFALIDKIAETFRAP